MQLVSIGKLVPYVNNARTHSKEQITKLRSSLREFGFVNPVIIDREFNVIAGHGRILAAKEENIEQVPCVFVDYLTEAQKKAYILADNRFALDAGWDEDMEQQGDLETLNRQIAEMESKRNTLEGMIQVVCGINEEQIAFDEELWGGLLEHIVVKEGGAAVVVFKGGIEIVGEG